MNCWRLMRIKTLADDEKNCSSTLELRQSVQIGQAWPTLFHWFIWLLLFFKPDQPDEPDEQDRIEKFFCLLLGLYRSFFGEHHCVFQS